jgi:uncharacterized membrane protein
MKRIWGAAALCLCLAMLSLPSPLWADQYYFYDLGTAFNANTANALNNKGEVVGSYFPNKWDYNSNSAFFWNKDTGFKNLGSLGTTYKISQAYGINDNSQVVGSTTFGTSGYPFAFIWSQNTGMNLLNQVTANSAAYSINNNGEAVGFQGGTTTLSPRNAASWNTQTGAFSYWQEGVLYSVNSAAKMVGQTEPWGGALFGPVFFFEPPPTPDHWSLITLGELQTNDNPAFRRWGAKDINNNGLIVGFSADIGVSYGVDKYYATIWEGPYTDFETNIHIRKLSPDDPGNSTANAINNAGDKVVGTSNGRACIWIKDADGNYVMLDLNSLVNLPSDYILANANDINDNGWIVGEGNHGAFLLTTEPLASLVPLPSSLLLFGPGLLGLAGWRRWRTTPSSRSYRVKD